MPQPAFSVRPASCTLFRMSSMEDRKSTRLNSSHVEISYAVFCLKKKKLKFLNTSSSLGLINWFTWLLFIVLILSSEMDFVFFFYCGGAHRDLHSFPTRRSSD